MGVDCVIAHIKSQIVLFAFQREPHHFQITIYDPPKNALVFVISALRIIVLAVRTKTKRTG